MGYHCLGGDMAMKLVGFVILSTVLVVAEGSSLAPGAACLFDGQCESGLCRERSANVLDFAKVCCKNNTDTSCKSCKEGSGSDAGVCLSYGTCNVDGDCASGVCRQGETTSAGTKTCCAPGVSSTCDVCTISNVTAQSTVLAFNPIEGGLCVEVANGGRCKLYDDECLDGRCVFRFLGAPDARCCKDVGLSCTLCSQQGFCIENRCSSCVGGETCVAGFTGSSNGCCKTSVDASRCEQGCNLNGDCNRESDANILDYVPTIATFLFILLMFVGINAYVRYKLLPAEENDNTVGIDGYGNAPVRVLTPTYDSEGTETGAGAVTASFVRESIDNEDLVAAEIIVEEGGLAQDGEDGENEEAANGQAGATVQRARVSL